MAKFDYLKSVNATYIDEMYGAYLKNPDSVESSWRYLFEGVELAAEWQPQGLENGAAGAPALATAADWEFELKVSRLIEAYRTHGKLLADTNPLIPPASDHTRLAAAAYGLSAPELKRPTLLAGLLGLAPGAAVTDLIARLKQLYCGTIAIECENIGDAAERDWLRSRIESGALIQPLPKEARRRALQRLTDAECFERFLHTRYVAQKRFSVEGGDGVIPMLDQIVELGAETGATDFVLGMAHRGRLNVLTHVMGKKPEYIFTEFEGTYHVDPTHGEGDVKYHMGYSVDATTTSGKKVHLSLAFNPSHLEFVNPVVEGMVRAKQRLMGDASRSKVFPILIHGDAALAGQGVCYETLNMSQLRGYATGGTIHIVINNQVGFTTDSVDARSSRYCTDLAKVVDAPVFHVHGDDADALGQVTRLCVEYRQKFHKDAFIDLICYRKHGHNEGDEPSYTQPLMYKKIKAHPSPREAYAARLAREGVVSDAEAQSWVEAANQRLMQAQAVAKKDAPHPAVSAFEGRWKALRQPHSLDEVLAPVRTAVAGPKLMELATRLNTLPAGFTVHPKLARFFEARLNAVQSGTGIDWGNGEALAYASLLVEGFPVRITGQDAERGTFTHRHSVLNDFETGQAYTPLNHLAQGQAPYDVHNSLLSETAVMGFEYGYSLADPKSLVIWEAQFGDFANGAQVIIDQFLAASESKWRRMSGLVLLLPHGYEGQGPEHSSGRIERFLQLCGRENLTVCNFTTPAQFFHALRRQVLREFRKPMVVLTPKSGLRHPMAISTLADFTDKSFEEVLADPQATPGKVTRVLLCSGKVYYDLVAEREKRKLENVAILRVEQLYPWPGARLESLLAAYPKAIDLVWVQEEPQNMGAWSHVHGQLTGALGTAASRPTIRYVGRGVAAAPAVGSPKVHEKEQRGLVDEALKA